MLWEWCRYFVGLCEDQVDFMGSMLDLPQLRDRLRAHVMVEGATQGITEYREEAVLPLQAVAVSGAMSRAIASCVKGLRRAAQ